MKHKFSKPVSLILALLIVLLQFGVVTANASSSAKGQTVYFKRPAEWKGRVDANTGAEILPAAYVAGGTDGQHVPWVGEHMTLVDEENDIWSYTIPGDQTLLNFNTGQQRDWQTVDLAIPGGDMIFLIDNGAGTKTATGHWEPYNTEEPRVAINTGVFQFVGEVTINLYCFNCDSAYYSVDGGEQTSFESGQPVTIGADTAPLSSTDITLTAVKGETSYSYEYTFNKNNSRTVYAKNAAGWDHVYIHYWGGESTSVWPGVKMKPYGDSEDVFYCEIPSKSTNYKFNNGGKENAEGSEQTVNLATQDIVEGVSEVFVINPLSEGESANTGEYVSLDRALSDEPVEGMPIIAVESLAPAFNEEFGLDLTLRNVPQLSGYVVNLSFDKSVIAPVSESGEIDATLGKVIYNTKANGDLVLVCSGANAVDYTEKALLVSVPFKVVASESKQIKVGVKVSDMFADENTEVPFTSSNLVAGKVTVGVDKSVLKEKLDYISGLDESKYTAVTYRSAVTAAKNAQAVYDSVTATQDTVDAQAEALTEAIDALVETQSDGDCFYFKNTPGWDEVYAYWWGGETPCAAFPGIKATPVSGRPGCFFVELPEDAAGLNFNSGKAGSEGGQQTDSITGDKLVIGNIFIPNPEDSYEKNGGIRYRGVSEKYVPNIFYFRNTVGWEAVYAYWWGGETPCAAFPGIPATKVDGATNLYSVQLPEDATGLNFNSGKAGSEGGQQTDSITGDKLTFGNVFIPDPEDSYEKNGGIRYRGVSEKYVPNTIYFKNVMKWDEVYAYWWGSTTECLPFPGVKPKKLAGYDDIYYITFPEDATGFNFSNGKPGSEGGEQTSSISAFEKGKILIIDPDSAYEKNGGTRYNASYDLPEKYTTGIDVLVCDVDGDGTVSITDATYVQLKAAELLTLDDVQAIAADVNGDGVINVDDATLIQKYCVEIETDTQIGSHIKYRAA